MCTSFFALGQAGLALVLAHNRDEFFDRPAQPAQFWPEAPNLLAGMDLRQGGTWLGMSTAGRLAFVTNFRKGLPEKPGGLSRGLVVKEFLLSALPATIYSDGLRQRLPQYRPFNMIYGDAENLRFFSTETAQDIAIPPGIHGLSNHLLNTPWPKIERGKVRFAQILTGTSRKDLVPALFALLGDQSLAADDSLPDTGIGIDRERLLSAIFIRLPSYGTRVSTVIVIDRQGEVSFTERTYSLGLESEDREYRFSIKS